MDDGSLLDAITAHPRDDAARLAYGEALSKRGDPRGELISVQCARAEAERGGAALAVLSALRAREAKLLPAGERRWREAHGLPDEVFLALERGLPDELLVPPKSISPALFELRPMPRLVLVRVDVDAALELARNPGLAKVRDLELDYHDRQDQPLKALCASPHLGGLRALTIGGSGVGVQGLRALARAFSLGPLEHLDLSKAAAEWSDDVTPDVAALLERHALTSLVLRRRHLAPQREEYSISVGELLRTKSATSLRHLDLGGCMLGEVGARALAEAPALAGLRSLVVWNDDLDVAAARAIAAAPHLAGLAMLDAGANQLGDDGAAALAKMPGLVELRLAHAGVGSRGVEALVSSRLERVDLRGTELEPSSRKTLVARFGPRARV